MLLKLEQHSASHDDRFPSLRAAYCFGASVRVVFVSRTPGWTPGDLKPVSGAAPSIVKSRSIGADADRAKFLAENSTLSSWSLNVVSQGLNPQMQQGHSGLIALYCHLHGPEGLPS